jgi:hypothetical protein
MINWTEQDIKFLYEICEKLRDKIPFAFSRFGDGEWLTISQVQPNNTNCDGNKYYKDLGKRLDQIISEKQDYYIGHQNVSSYTLRDNYTQDWVNSDIFHELSELEGLDYIFNLLDDVHVVYIGNKSLSTLSFINEFIEIPYNNVWTEYNIVLDEIKNKIQDGYHKTFLISAGMSCEVFIHDLWEFNKSNTYVDMGSVFDPYVGRITRSYHHRLQHIPKIL